MYLLILCSLWLSKLLSQYRKPLINNDDRMNYYKVDLVLYRIFILRVIVVYKCYYN